MTVGLRAHHLLCVLTYVGRGYGAAFTANLDTIARRIAAGETVRLVAGPDDICAPLLHADDPHCTRAGPERRDRHAARSLAPLLGRPLAPGDTLVLDAALIARLRAAFADGRARRACVGCQWAPLCSAVAAENYAGARLRAATGETQPPDGRVAGAGC